jgi:hypothetical protein
MFKRAPNKWLLPDLIAHAAEGPHKLVEGVGYMPARPEGFFSLQSRIALAWAVFTGRADVVFWP